MGMYTGLKLNVKLKEEMKDQWLPVLRVMLKNEDDYKKPDEVADHELFHTQRWTWMFYGSSTYLEPEYIPDSKLDECNNELFVRFNIKNYDFEIQKFLDWLSPYVEILKEGKYRYEEYDEDSQIILEEGKLKIIHKGELRL
jgi:hypothetical protein